MELSAPRTKRAIFHSSPSTGEVMTFQTQPRYAAYLILVLAGVIGGGGLLVFIVFLFVGPFNIVDLGLSENQALLMDALLCLAFFIQHSVMARKSVHQRLARLMPAQYGGSLYAIVSGVFVLGLVMIWQESSSTLFTLQGFLRWSFHTFFFLAIACILWGLSVGFLDLYVLRPIVHDLRGIEQKPVSLITNGPYRWVRHPLYLSSFFLLWSYPDLTLDRLLLNLVFTIYVTAGILLEERDLVNTFGQEYRDYQRNVPMILPIRIRLG
jgi:protein-S-isoprenylcysteine O-methyltransferase Ste14